MLKKYGELAHKMLLVLEKNIKLNNLRRKMVKLATENIILLILKLEMYMAWRSWRDRSRLFTSYKH